MRTFHIVCGHEVETSPVDIECPMVDVVGAISPHTERSTKKIVYRAFCPKCKREVYVDELIIA